MATTYYADSHVQLIHADVMDGLATLGDNSIHCVVTSPPYFALRDYGTGPAQIGLEESPQAHVQKMIEVFREVRRVLHPSGTLWMNYGDSYANALPRAAFGDQASRGAGATTGDRTIQRNWSSWNLKPKDLTGMGWRVAFALQEDGWWFRSPIIWSKPNPMPESVADRPTIAHEYMFLMAKSQHYFYDAFAIREPAEKTGTLRHLAGGSGDGPAREGLKREAWLERHANDPEALAGRNKRSVWEIPIEAYPDAHFATFPSALVTPCVLAGTSEKGACVRCLSPFQRMTAPTEDYAKHLGKAWHDHVDDLQRGQRNNASALTASYQTTGWEPTCTCFDPNGDLWGGSDEPEYIVPCTVLDPFIGSGTTAMVAKNLNRKAIGIDLSEEYLGFARDRIRAGTAAVDLGVPGMRVRVAKRKQHEGPTIFDFEKSNG